jgi:hypothetical protein
LRAVAAVLAEVRALRNALLEAEAVENSGAG